MAAPIESLCRTGTRETEVIESDLANRLPAGGLGREPDGESQRQAGEVDALAERDPTNSPLAEVTGRSIHYEGPAR